MKDKGYIDYLIDTSRQPSVYGLLSARVGFVLEFIGFHRSKLGIVLSVSIYKNCVIINLIIISYLYHSPICRF